MIPIEWLQTVQSDRVSPGDLAFVLGQHFAPSIVMQVDGQAPGEKHTLLAYPNEAQCPFENVEYVSSDIMIIRDWQVVVDHSQAVKLDLLADRYGALVVKKDQLSLVCLSGNGQGYATIKFHDLPPGSQTSREYAFPSWKIVKMHGDTEIVLLDHTRPAASGA